MPRSFLLAVVLCATALHAQNYTSYFTGNAEDLVTEPLGGTCMMGGATEHDSAMVWFLERADGGDILVLRASGSDGYNDYMYTDLGGINSVETIVFHNALASTDPYVLGRIDAAEAIWFAGGDQWNYVSYWRDTEVAERINTGIAERNIAIGGTSAGMAILGDHYFSAENGSVSSAAALADPYAEAVTVDHAPFLNVPFLQGVITDTHYDDPDRRGRHTVFLARMVTDEGLRGLGIACNEYVAVTVDPQGIAHVYGEWPEYEEYAFFLQANCASPFAPELCAPGSPLTWERNGAAVKVYKVPGLMQGDHWFDLNDRESESGGTWEHWTVSGGVFNTAAGTAIDCATGLAEAMAPTAQLRWDAERREALITGLPQDALLQAYASDGRAIALQQRGFGAELRCRFPDGPKGLVMLVARWAEGQRVWRLMP